MSVPFALISKRCVAVGIMPQVALLIVYHVSLGNTALLDPHLRLPVGLELTVTRLNLCARPAQLAISVLRLLLFHNTVHLGIGVMLEPLNVQSAPLDLAVQSIMRTLKPALAVHIAQLAKITVLYAPVGTIALQAPERQQFAHAARTATKAQAMKRTAQRGLFVLKAQITQ
jgi:hypothetical protein